MSGQSSPSEPFPDDDAGAARRPWPVSASDATDAAPEDDDGHFEWLVREMAAGRLLPPSESSVEGPAISVGLGDACDLDPDLLAALCGPDDPGVQATPSASPASAVFRQDGPADVLGPGPVLAALTARAASRVAPGSGSWPVARPSSLADGELIGVLQATRRLANLVSWQQTVVIAEFARRRQAQFEAARARGVPVGCRDGEFPGAELAMELVATGPYTSGRIDTAIELTTRLPLTLAWMADGQIDLARACAIAARTQAMTDADAAYADRVLAAAAPDLRLDQLARKAEALELKLAPEAVKARKELARHLDQRVETRREESGNACLAGRELDTADVIASKAHIDALAARLRDSGLFDARIGCLRALVLTDLTQGRNPLDRLTARPTPEPEGATPAGAPQMADAPQMGGTPGTGNSPGTGNAREIARAPETGDDPVNGQAVDAEDEPSGSPWPAQSLCGAPVPLPALVNLLVPAGTLLGWGTAPAQAAGWGLLDADETRALIRAAARHPRTRWCMTITVILSFRVSQGCDLRRPVVDSVADGTRAA